MRLLKWTFQAGKYNQLQFHSNMETQFSVLSVLGKGSFGEVVKVRRLSDGKDYALKKVRVNKLNDKDIQNALNEVRILASIDDTYIIKYKDAFYDADSQSICTVMEFADGGDLQSKIDNHYKKGTAFQEEQVWKIAGNLLLGLQVLHEKKIIHRDIKSANVFFAGGIAKLGDMNVSKITEASLAYTQTGTPYYASPQIWRQEPYSYKSDIWSFGCVLYEMCALRPPFGARNIQELYRKVQKGVFDRIPSKYSAALANFVNACIVVDVKKRANLNTLLEIIALRQPQDQRHLLRRNSSDKQLLKTIKLPKNMNELNLVLPEPCYESHKPNKTENTPKAQRPHSKQRRLNILDLFTIKKITPQKRPESRCQSPPMPVLRQIKSQKCLPPPIKSSHQLNNQPVSAQVLPEVPSFKKIIGNFQNPIQQDMLYKIEQIDINRKQRYEKQKQYLAQLSAKRRPSIQLILPSINRPVLRI